jgi:hypothetical protein
MAKFPGSDFDDKEPRKGFLEDYASDLLKIARRETDGKNAQTPQDAANELIDLAVESLESPGGVLPEPIRDYLHRALCDIQDGKAADVALGIKVPAGRNPLGDPFVATTIAAYAHEIRHGLAPADAKRAVLRQIESIHDGGRTMDWIDDLLTKHPNKLRATELMSDEELEYLSDFDSLPKTGIK